MNLKKIFLTFLAAALFLGSAYFLTFFGARSTSYVAPKEYNSEQLLEKLEKVDKLEKKFFEKQKLGSIKNEDIDVLDEAILTLQDYITSSQTQDRELHSRLSKLRTISQNFRGETEAENIVKLSLEADEAFTSQNMILALDLYKKLKQKQEKINKLYPDSKYYDVRRLAKADQMLKLVSAAPLGAELQELQRQIDFSIKSKRWNEAQKLLEKAIEKQSYINKEFSNTSFANFSKIRQFEVELDSLKAAPMENEIIEAVKKGKDFESKNDYNQAAESYSLAYERQKELNLLFDKSRYSSDEKIREFEKLRDTALSQFLYAEIKKERAVLDNLLVEGGVSETIPNKINDLLIKCESLKKDYPASALLNQDDILSLRFLSYLGSNLPLISKIVGESLIKIDANSPIKMLKTEVSQKLYHLVMQENPSRNVGDDFPVETVSFENASDFCKRLSWILAKNVRLPSRKEYYNAIGLLKYVDLNAISWNAGNSALRTHKVGTSEANLKGFYDLLGNVAEFSAEASNAGIIGGSSQTWTDSLGEIPYESINQNRRGDRMVGFRFVVEDIAK